MIAVKDWAWFYSLRPGDPIAVRLHDKHFSRPWRKAIVSQRTQKTVWWDVPKTPWMSSKTTLQNQEWDLRPWTEEDEAAEWAEGADALIREWLDKHVPRTPYASPKPLDPVVRDALVRMLTSLGVKF